MKCALFGCIKSEFDPMTGNTRWFNYCPRCKTLLDR